jgi:hypothetical protein
MIELAIKNALERITGMNAYPLLLPDTSPGRALRISVFQTRRCLGNIADRIDSARFQVTIYRIDDYTSLLQLDKKIWSD